MFKIHTSANKWQESLLKEKGGPFKTKMDLYYIYFMTGIGLKLDKPPHPEYTKELSDINDSYPMEFSSSIRYKIAGLFLYRDMVNNNLPSTDKSLVKKKIEDTFSKTDGNTFLEPDAIKQMNIYAFNGFNYIKEKMNVAPDSANFLVFYHKELMPQLFK